MFSLSTDMDWKENTVQWDMKTSRYIRHMQYADVKLLVVYHRLYDDMYVVDQLKTTDGSDITDLVRDRVIERIELILAKTAI